MSVKWNEDLNISVSDATNAYDLLTDVIEQIVGDPRRFQMDIWGERGNLFTYYNKNHYNAPRCGTAACVAGWVVFLREPAADRLMNGNQACDILIGEEPLLQFDETADGFTTESKEALDRYRHIRLDLNQMFYSVPHDENAVCIPEGTQAHVDYMVPKIRQFQERYADLLKARTF